MRFCDIFRTYRHPRTWKWSYRHKKTGAKVSPDFDHIWERDRWLKLNKANLMLEEILLEVQR